ncbi:Multidrug ABC transporter ATP-binding protein OS=Lysinibacillus sphaericus OX=1421 GN=LS41612_02720 PE=4 SV=1 [Lysinibacillus sphaericus]
MIVLQVNQLYKSFIADEILSGVKLEVQHRDRVALVGRNGAGKSTLQKSLLVNCHMMLAILSFQKVYKSAIWNNMLQLNSTLSIWDEMMTIFEPLLSQEKALRSLEQQMANPAVYDNSDMYTKIMSEYDQLQHDFKDAGGYQYESDTRYVLHGMQFYPEDYEKPISSLSGASQLV